MKQIYSMKRVQYALFELSVETQDDQGREVHCDVSEYLEGCRS